MNFEEKIDKLKLDNEILLNEKKEIDKLNNDNKEVINNLKKDIQSKAITIQKFMKSNNDTQKDLENLSQMKVKMDVLLNEIGIKENQNEELQILINEQKNKINGFNNLYDKYKSIISEKNDEIEMLKKQIMLLKNDINDKKEEKKIGKKNEEKEIHSFDYDDYSNNNIIEENPKLKNLNLRGAIIWNTNDFSTPSNIGNQADDISISESILP